jgi:transposase-like protein
MTTTEWTSLSAEQKAALVRRSIETDGLSYAEAAKRHGTTRVAIAGVVSRARDRGERMHKPVLTRKPKNRSNDAITRQKAAKAKVVKQKHQGFAKFVALAIPVEAVDSAPLKPGAWAPLPESQPVPLVNRTGCAWPVEVEGKTLFCNLPHLTHAHWCPAHVITGTRPVVVGTPKRHAKKPSTNGHPA